MNCFTVIGRIVENVKTDEKTKDNYIVIAVQRSYKNQDGIYEADYIKCNLSPNIAQNVNDYCKVGDVVGIKSRLESDKDNNMNYKIVVDRISFLSSKSKELEQE